MKDKQARRIPEDELVRYYMELIEEKMPDFAEVKEKYLKTVQELKLRLPNEEEKFDVMCRSRDRLTFLQILFAGNFGFKANLEHFKKPAERTFMDVGVDACLREMTMKGMKDYQVESEKISTAVQLIPEDICEQILDYHSYLDTVVPKLAHYKGYLMADQLLRYTEPGYHNDLILTHAYQRWMKEYFEADI